MNSNEQISLQSELSGHRYQDLKGGRILFVSDGISNGQKWGTFYWKRTGAQARLVSKYLPMRDTATEAQADLDRYAAARKYQPL